MFFAGLFLFPIYHLLSKFMLLYGIKLKVSIYLILEFEIRYDSHKIAY